MNLVIVYQCLYVAKLGSIPKFERVCKLIILRSHSICKVKIKTTLASYAISRMSCICHSYIY